MTEQEYLDPKRFPLTTQQGLSLKQQRMIDAINLDDLTGMQERGKTAGRGAAANPAGTASQGSIQGGESADYVKQAMANLQKTSRTAGGVVDASASPGKAG